MAYVEFPKEEANIDFDGGFEFEFTQGGGVRIFNICNNNGQEVRVSRKIYAQMCQYARGQLGGLQVMVDSLMAESHRGY